MEDLDLFGTYLGTRYIIFRSLYGDILSPLICCFTERGELNLLLWTNKNTKNTNILLY